MSDVPASSPLKVWWDRDGALLRLRLSRPKANIVDAAMIGALSAALTEHRDAQMMRGVLIDHEGPHFSFGASVEEHMPDRVAAMLATLHRLVLDLLAYPLPVMVAARGQCLGGGLEVATAGHMLFVHPDTRLGQPEIQLGVFPPAASCLLPEKMPLGAAEDLLLSGRSIDGAEAARLGLAQRASDDPESAALAWFDQGPARHSPAVLRLGTKAARLGLVDRVRDKLGALEEMYLSDLMRTHDANEGLTAFLEKRPATWEGR